MAWQQLKPSREKQIARHWFGPLHLVWSGNHDKSTRSTRWSSPLHYVQLNLPDEYHAFSEVPCIVSNVNLSSKLNTVLSGTPGETEAPKKQRENERERMKERERERERERKREREREGELFIYNS